MTDAILMYLESDETGRSSFRSKLVPHTKLELPALAAEAVLLDGIAVIKPERTDWQIQADSDTDVLIQSSRKPSLGTRDLHRTESPRTGIDVTAIIKNREAYAFDDGDRVLYRPSVKGITADRIPLRILGPYIPESEPAKRIRATGIEAVENRDDVSESVLQSTTDAISPFKRRIVS